MSASTQTLVFPMAGPDPPASTSLLDKNIPLIKLDWTMDTEVLQRSRSSISQVYRIKALYLKQLILEPIEDNDFIVMKIYDPKYPTEILDDSRCDESCVTARYDMEKKCIDMLHQVPNFNSVHGHHNELIIDYYLGFLEPIIGKDILSRYIDRKKISKRNPSLYRQAQEQLSLIHKSGIVYNYIDEENIVVERDTNNVYFFDFSSVKFITNGDTYLYFSSFNHGIYVDIGKTAEEFKKDEGKIKYLFM